MKLMMAALLGFSTACSTVKNTPQGGEADHQETPTQLERIRLMYGTPSPRVKKNEVGPLDTTGRASAPKIEATPEDPTTKKE